MVQTITAIQAVLCVIAGMSMCYTLQTFCFRNSCLILKSLKSHTVLSTNTSHVVSKQQQLPNQTITKIATNKSKGEHAISKQQNETAMNNKKTVHKGTHMKNKTAMIVKPATNTSRGEHAMNKQHNEAALVNKPTVSMHHNENAINNKKTVSTQHETATQKLPRKHVDNADMRTLVVVTGQPRGSAYAWKSLDEHVLKPLNAHLATYFTDDCVASTYLAKMATYQWSAPAQTDWGFFLDQAESGCSSADKNKSEWRSLFEFKDQFLGGITGSGHPGSGGIMLSFRWLVQQKINQLNLTTRYDYMVLSRADQMHICNHPPISKTEKVTVPFGLEYGGWPDRHSFGSISVMDKAINITTELVCDTDRWLPILRSMNSQLFNPEQVLKIIWDNNRLMVTQVNRTMFTVRSSTDPTRWSWGQEDPLTQPYNITVKYPEELELVKLQCADEAAIAKELRDFASMIN